MTATADLLRRAAVVARSVAEGATGGPWEIGASVHALPTGAEIAAPAFRPDAEHIALWHPAVVLAVAAWLEASAQLHPPSEDGWGDDHASAVGRALLGEEILTPAGAADELARLAQEWDLYELGDYGDPHDRAHEKRLKRYADAMEGRGTTESMAEAAMRVADEERAAHWEQGRRHGLRQAHQPGTARVRQLEAEIEQMGALEEANSAAWQKQCARVRELENRAEQAEEWLRAMKRSWKAGGARIAELDARLDAVRELHRYWDGDCFECGAPHPCPTLRAIGAGEGS